MALALAVSGCVAPPIAPRDQQVPPFARRPYQPFSREAAIAIATGEWRAFGSLIVIGNRPIAGDPWRERAEGLWQRVGLYWWLGLPYGSPESGWTGKHDARGQVFPRNADGDYAWSAAFIDYVMRMAGAAGRFPYSPNHATYIDAARKHAMGELPDLAITAWPPQIYAPQLGDLICMWREGRPITYQDLPTGAPFPSHCDIVVSREPGEVGVIGGNVDNAVAMTSVPVAPDGRLTDAGGRIIDPDHPWFVVIQVLYER